jgi:hypothetical protein
MIPTNQDRLCADRKERDMKDEKRAADDAERDALVIAEAALADIGDAEREPGDDLAWCERRAAQALPAVRAALSARADGGKGEAVGVLTVSRYRGINGMVNTDFEYLGDLPDGSYHCYTAPQAECAPREAQPIYQIEDEGAWMDVSALAFTSKLIGKRRKRIVYAAPTPERAQPISDAMMDLVDRLGSEASEVEPRAWKHLLVYAPERADAEKDSLANVEEVYRYIIKQNGRAANRTTPENICDVFEAIAAIAGEKK